MIDIKSKKYGDFIWAVKQDILDILTPIQVCFDSLESPNSEKLSFVKIGDKRLCYPTNLLFENKYEAEIYASIVFVKLYCSADQNTMKEMNEEIFHNACVLLDKYEKTHPDKFLYHWMNNVPSR